MAFFPAAAPGLPRVVACGPAAVKFAATEQAVRGPDGDRRNVQLLSVAPQIKFDPTWIVETARESGIALATPPRNDGVPTIEEMARYIDSTRAEHVVRFCIIALTTWARRETIEELDLDKQADKRTNLLDLNEHGRLQTHKRGPIIRLTENLRAWWEEWGTGRPLISQGRDSGAIKKAVQRTNARWMLAEARGSGISARGGRRDGRDHPSDRPALDPVALAGSARGVKIGAG